MQLNRIGKKLKSLRHKPKVIYDVHEPFPPSIRYAYATNRLEKIINILHSVYVYHWELKCSKLYDFIITTEENVYHKFNDYIKNNKVDIVYNYTDLNLKYQNIPFNDREYDAIYCGGITAIRGIFQIIETARIAKMKSRNLKFLILGPVLDKNSKSKIVSLINEYRLSENIILKDRVPYGEVPAFYNMSKIGLAIFLNNPLNQIILPIKTFEYMAFGLPIVCSNFGHLLKYTTGNNTGIAVNSQNPDEIYNAIVKILDNKSIYEKYKNNSLKASKEKYDWNLMDRKLNDIYSKIL
jgi:glycosyltransferase involved in cell wall biosynthesis